MPARPRLFDLRASGAPESVGLCSSDITSIAAAVNEAQERLMNDPLAPDEGWYGTYARYAFNVSRSEPSIVTPQEVARIISLDVCKRPMILRNSFYEFQQFGIGFQPPACSTTVSNVCQGLAAYERETTVTMEPLLSTPQLLRVYMQNSNDAGRTCQISGEDQNGSPILFVDAATGFAGSGEVITFAAPFADSVNEFSLITGVQKQKTFGEISIFQVDPDTGVETSLVVMGPSETTASFRKYVLTGLPANCCNGCSTSTTLQVLAMCKLDFTPVQVDSDYLMIQSIPALLDEMMATRWGRVDSLAAQTLSANKHASALRLLFGQIDSRLGKSQTAIQRHIFGSSNALMRQPV